MITSDWERSEAAKDDAQVRKAALSVGSAIALASGLVVFVGCLILIVVSLFNAVQLPPRVEPTIGPDGRVGFHEVPRVGWLNADTFIWAVAIMAIVSLILTSLVGWFTARRAVRPMAEALRLQRHFIADASHELRTPLTALHSRVQILQRRLDAGKPLDPVIHQLQEDTTNMSRILDDMLLTIEGTAVISGTKTAIVNCLRQAVISLEPLAEQSQVALTLRASSDMMVGAPETSLTRAAVAVIDNAIQHSTPGSSVEVNAQSSGRMAVVRVTDHGKGITGVDPQHIFDRFAHGAETGRKRSFGLGLALASEVAQRAGGDIQVESTSTQGTTFALSFPLA